MNLFLFHRISDFVAIESCSQMLRPLKILKILLIFGFCNNQWINFPFFSSFSCMFYESQSYVLWVFPILRLWLFDTLNNIISSLSIFALSSNFFSPFFLLRIKIFSFTIISLMFNFYTFLVFLYILLIFIWMEKTRMK